MSFSCPIQRGSYYGAGCARVEVPLTVIGSIGEATYTFRFDTGCDVTTVSEDVAAARGLPTGGTTLGVRGSTGTASGRLVPVTFRFPPDMISGSQRPPVTSLWIVLGGRTRLALLSLREAEFHFYIGTDDTYMTFTNR
jgi:hypothetical protein